VAEIAGYQEALDPAQSRLRVFVFRGGRAANLGHNHVLLAEGLSGALIWPDATAAQERRWAEVKLEASFRLDALRMDPPAEREALGAAFASKLDEAATQATRANMLRSLEADAHPTVRLQVSRLVGEGPMRAAELTIDLHGQQRRQWVAVRLAGPPWRATGQAVLRQSDFGISPFSVLGGLLAVQDELVVEFDLGVC
jgi:hypothetical protein